MVTARCQSDGRVTAGKLQSFEFNRYKGNLSVTSRSGKIRSAAARLAKRSV
jgi:hypothetical protein